MPRRRAGVASMALCFGGRAASRRRCAGAASWKARSRRAARGAAAARRGRAARRGVGVVKKTRNGTRFVGRRARTSRGGIGNGFGGSGGLLVRHGDWCCCFLSLGLRARVRVDSCGSFAALYLSSSARRRRGLPPAAFLARFPARTAICAFGRWKPTLYSTLCSVLLANPSRATCMDASTRQVHAV